MYINQQFGKRSILESSFLPKIDEEGMSYYDSYITCSVPHVKWLSEIKVMLCPTHDKLCIMGYPQYWVIFADTLSAQIKF